MDKPSIIMDKPSSCDLLSDLPLSMIHCILERVPIRDAIKTSILSSHWRYKWATLPHLVFDEESVSSSRDYAVRLKNLISETLFLHQGPIHKFKLETSSIANCHNIHQWLIFLSRNGIRILILNFCAHVDRFCVHSSLYSCQNLSHLELVQCEISPPPPTFKGFLCLRCLVLDDVDVSSNTIESLAANSPLLEELTLNNSKILGLKIRAPNLKILYIGAVYNDICLYAPLLVKMQVSGFLDLPKGGLQQKTSACNYTNFLGGFTSLEELIGYPRFIKFLSIGFESCQSSLVFHHLRDIKLFEVNFHDMKVTSAVVRLITDAPNLHKLEISSLYLRPGASESFWDSECAPNFTFERLKVIEMKNVLGRVDEMKFIKFLLASSPVLEKMILKPGSYVDAEQLNLAAELLRYRRASSNAEILFRKR